MPKEIEASVQLRLYTLSKRHLAIVVIAFCACFGLTVFVGILGPNVLVTEQHLASSIYSQRSIDRRAGNAHGLVWSGLMEASVGRQPREMAASAFGSSVDLVGSGTNSNATGRWLREGPFMLQTSTALSLFNQQLWLLMKPSPRSAPDAGGSFDIPFNVSLEVTGVDADKVVRVATVINRTRVLRCESESCQDVMLLHLANVSSPCYTVAVVLSAVSEQRLAFKDAIFLFKTYNPTFTQFEIWFRFVFVAISFAVSIVFLYSLRIYRWHVWSTEQKWMAILLPLLLLYNNPLFPASFLVHSWVPLFCDGLFQATFLCALLLFFLCLYHELRVMQRTFLAFYAPKLIVVGLVWLPAVILSSWQAVHEQADPSFQYKLDTVGFSGLKIFFYISGSLYILFLLYLLVRAYMRLRRVPYFGIRLKFTSGFMLIVMCISIAILMLRFGTRIASEDFIPEITARYENAAEFLSFFGLLNVYMCTMAVVYSPPKHAVPDLRLLENPAELLLNDSEDDVVYTSEKGQLSKSPSLLNTFDSD